MRASEWGARPFEWNFTAKWKAARADAGDAAEVFRTHARRTRAAAVKIDWHARRSRALPVLGAAVATPLTATADVAFTAIGSVAFILLVPYVVWAWSTTG